MAFIAAAENLLESFHVEAESSTGKKPEYCSQVAVNSVVKCRHLDTWLECSLLISSFLRLQFPSWMRIVGKGSVSMAL